MPHISSQSSAQDDPRQELRSKLAELQQRIMLNAPRSAADNAERDLDQAKRDLADVRRQGHRYDADLEKALDDQGTRVKETRDLVYEKIDRLNRTIRYDLESLARQLDAASGGWDASTMRSRIEGFERELETVEREMEQRTGDVYRVLGELCSRVRNLAWSYEQWGDAIFQPEEGENLVSAWEAEWFAEEGEKHGYKGVLFLTTKRVLFERKEKVKQSKGLFAKKERKHELAFWQPAEHLSRSVDTEQRKFLSKKEMLSLEFSQGQPRVANLRLRTDSEAVDRRFEDFLSGRLNEVKES